MNTRYDQGYSRRCPDDDKQVVGMLYVPDQEWIEIYTMEQGLCRGTIFRELDKPWLVGGCHE